MIVQTYDSVETWSVWNDVDGARHYAIDASLDGRDGEWVQVVEATDGDPTGGRNGVIVRYERGVSVDPRIGKHGRRSSREGRSANV